MDNRSTRLRYLGRPETDQYRCSALENLGGALRHSRPEEARAVLEANLALRRRYFSHHAQRIIGAQNNLAICLTSLARHDEALKLKREIYASSVALQGVSSEQTLLLGSNLVNSLINQKHWDEAISLARDQLLPAAR